MKLNIRPDNQTYSIEEKVKVENGQYKGTLKHDNVIKSSILVNTKPQLQGEYVNQYTITNPEEKEWKTFINIYTKYDEVYISYETLGDQVDADDFNYLNKIKLEKKDLPNFSEIEDKIDELSVNKAERTEVLKIKSEIYEKINSLVIDGESPGANEEGLLEIKQEITKIKDSVSSVQFDFNNIEKQIEKIDLEKASKEEVKSQIDSVFSSLLLEIDKKTKELSEDIVNLNIVFGNRIEEMDKNLAMKVGRSEIVELTERVDSNSLYVQSLQTYKAEKRDLDKLEAKLEELNIPDGVDLTPVYEEIKKLKEATLKTGGITCAELRGF